MRPRLLIRILSGLLLALSAIARPAAAQPVSGAEDRFFLTSDGVRLHYLEAGRAHAHTILLVPGWTTPGWIFTPQIRAFSARYRVIALDPRGQGASELARSGYGPARRGQDIGELIDRLGPAPVLLVGWSLGVLDTLAYVHADGDGRLAGLVLVDNSIGEEPAPAIAEHFRPHLPYELRMSRFVRGMFRTRQSEAYLETLTEAMLRTPESVASALLAYPLPRSYWREAVYSTSKPLLYAIRPIWEGQAENLARRDPAAEIAVFPGAGHALFVDDAGRFDAVVEDFIERRIWP
ncbi:MAG: alpha/beta hydrolase [Alphaproteobacteria bacterium]|nr:alpha/beta hydrolase [Alphaproteobacteria bacterium]